MGGYRRLSPRDRYQIEFLKSKSYTNAEIARELGRSRSTITRELKLCRGNYSESLASAKSASNALRRSSANRKIKGDLKVLIDFLLEEDWSPEQIEETLRKEKISGISLKTIYRYVERDKLNGGRLKYHLRILRKKRKDRKMPKYRSYQGLLHNRTPISKRPKIVEKRCRIGDYERDTVLGSRGGLVLLTIVDRKTRYLHLALLERNSAELVHRATVNLLKKHPVKTITNDNGAEFAFHQKTSKALAAKIYFSRSYRAWERGTNENTNGLLRQYFKKWQPIPMMSKKELKEIQDRLNNRPRKCLGFRTPSALYRHKPTGRLLR